MEKAKIFLWIMLMVCSLTVEAASVIKSIRYEGNETTRASILNREIYIQPGDVFDEKLLEDSRQAIMDLDLFKTVHYYIEENYPDGASQDQDSLIEITFVVEEKYFLLIFPRVKVSDEATHVGLQMRWNNVWGLNHELRLLVEDRGDEYGIDESRNAFDYVYPNINNTPYNLRLRLQTVNEVDDEGDREDVDFLVIDRQDDVYEIGISRWLNERGRNKGWFVGSSLVHKQRYNEVVRGNDESAEIDAYILGLDAGYRNVSTYEFNRGGKEYGYRLSWSDDRIGSDSEFTKHLLYYRSYYRFKKYPLANLNAQTLLGHSNNKVLDKYAFSLGSSDDLRGYENDQFDGNTMFLTNVEFMFPQISYSAVRYVYFIDMGNTYDSLNELFHDNLNFGTGFGFRWKLRAFVKLNLRADFGYGISGDSFKFTFGTHHAF